LAGHVESVENRRGAYRVMVGRPEALKSLGRLKRVHEDNIKNGYSRSGMGRHGLG
jgi:hypothetical protein